MNDDVDPAVQNGTMRRIAIDTSRDQLDQEQEGVVGKVVKGRPTHTIKTRSRSFLANAGGDNVTNQVLRDINVGIETTSNLQRTDTSQLNRLGVTVITEQGAVKLTELTSQDFTSKVKESPTHRG